MMRITLFGTRGSIAAPGPETIRYGGNTSTVEVCGNDGTVLVLDAGTGIRRLGMQIPATTTRVDILLTHLHMDHMRGLGFLVHSLTREPTFTYGGLRAACSHLRPVWLGICRLLFFRCISATCLAWYVTRYHAQHLKLVHSEYGRRLSVIRVRSWLSNRVRGWRRRLSM
jgi:phosphoribosyl 1,2-cyclic phosphodiesterase